MGDRQNTYGRFFVFNRRTNADTWDQSFQSGTTNYLNYYLGRAIVICGTDIYVSAPLASYRGYVRHYTRSSTSASTISSTIRDTIPAPSQLSTYDYFGRSIACSQDGLKLAIGAPSYNTGGVFIYQRTSRTQKFSQITPTFKSYGTSTSDYYGGSALTFSPDSKVLFVGGFGDDDFGSNRGNVFAEILDPFG